MAAKTHKRDTKEWILIFGVNLCLFAAKSSSMSEVMERSIGREETQTGHKKIYSDEFFDLFCVFSRLIFLVMSIFSQDYS